MQNNSEPSMKIFNVFNRNVLRKMINLTKEQRETFVNQVYIRKQDFIEVCL